MSGLARAQAQFDLQAGLGRMLAIQMSAYPSHWSDADKREMAELHLFGKAIAAEQAEARLNESNSSQEM
jgi:hypothetical protein